jgi:hypothetical protein
MNCNLHRACDQLLPRLLLGQTDIDESSDMETSL